ncbi:unnamed protein product [Staphylococcus haemolyticus JCSC1435]|uniref:Uncharacterized protein n=1 Tax=Staphylococcus haemolyticus (strain JCSC1435) TaxID=279808 RepID=Q4L3V8_STAHJ|nr:unnamed protein product [Staphylococcus haemolyticus JCSC1435]
MQNQVYPERRKSTYPTDRHSSNQWLANTTITKLNHFH